MKKLLSEFITKETSEKTGLISIKGTIDPYITGLEYDSRNVKKGNLFFALPGIHTDGSLYINDAIKNGAAAIVHEKDISDEKSYSDIVFIKVKSARFAMSPISASFYDFPSNKILVTGVTGTEGKSTTVFLIWQLLTLIGKRAGFISTVQHCLGDDIAENSEHQTTPEAPVVQRLLYEMVNNGCEYAVLESSSHGLSAKTNRLGDVNFCSGVFTNITHEHLEFHGTFEQYRYDKANLFRALNNYVPVNSFIKPFGVVNADDKNSQYFKKQLKHKTYSYSPAGREGDIVLKTIESSGWGNWYIILNSSNKERLELRDKLPGSFNCGNVMAALLLVSGLLELPLREIAAFVKNLKPVRGRMSTIDKGQSFEVVVDYAHTPSSFQAIFPPLRQRLTNSGGRIISLFGSAGERDTKKRSEQGKIAALYSDIIILADEDPRGEVPMSILEEIALGCLISQGCFTSQDCTANQGYESNTETSFVRNKNLFLIPDRPAAIRKAFSLAKKGDLVILLGKGHENSIIYADRAIPYDEITEAEKALEEML